MARGLQFVGGVSQAAVGGLLFAGGMAAAPTGAGVGAMVLGGVGVARGVDNMVAAIRGEQTVLGSVLTSYLGETGGAFGEIAFDILLGGGSAASARSLAPKSAGVMLGGGIDDAKGTFRGGAFDPETGTLHIGDGGHFDGMAKAGGTPHPGKTPGISTLETGDTVYWANDSLSLPKALTPQQTAQVQAGLESAFSGKTVKQLTSIGDVP